MLELREKHSSYFSDDYNDHWFEYRSFNRRAGINATNTRALEAADMQNLIFVWANGTATIQQNEEV